MHGSELRTKCVSRGLPPRSHTIHLYTQKNSVLAVPGALQIVLAWPHGTSPENLRPTAATDRPRPRSCCHQPRLRSDEPIPPSAPVCPLARTWARTPGNCCNFRIVKNTGSQIPTPKISRQYPALNSADVLTKPISRELFDRHCATLMGEGRAGA